MISGIGTDIVKIARFERLWQRHGRRACTTLLHPDEQADCLKHHDPARFLAKRFAAKEAFAKAVGTGLRYPVSLTHICIRHDKLGKPIFTFSDTLHTWLQQRQMTHSHLSISDEQDTVIAMVVIESAAAHLFNT